METVQEVTSVVTDHYQYFDDEVKKHLHTLNGIPLMGTSTVVGVLDKPLAYWAAGKAIELVGGWTKAYEWEKGKKKYKPVADRILAVEPFLEKLKTMDSKRFLVLLDQAYRAHNDSKESAAEAGTERHKALEAYVKGCLAEGGDPNVKADNMPLVGEFREWARDNIDHFLWSEIHGYSKTTWTGGVADVGWVDKKGKLVAGDFKSSRTTYFTQFVQVGGYDLMLSENGGLTADGKLIFTLPRPIESYCVIPFGAKDFAPQFIDNPPAYRKAFCEAAGLYKTKQDYDDLFGTT